MYIDFYTEMSPYASTILHLRHLLEDNHIGEKNSIDVKACLNRSNLIMHDGSVVDATIIAFPIFSKI